MSPILSPAQRRRAVTYNKAKARSIGWADRWPAVCSELAINTNTISAEDFCERVARWQDNNALKPPDGMFGKTTWRKMKAKSLKTYGTMALPAWLPRVPAPSPIKRLDFVAGPAPWMEIARREMMNNWRRGNTVIGEDDGTTDEGYFAATPYFGGKEQMAGRLPGKHSPHWCSAFVNYCLHTAGYSHTGSAGAISFVKRDWTFKALEKPERGCVIVVTKGSLEHVAFLDSWEDLPEKPNGNVKPGDMKGVRLLGGNQFQWVNADGSAWEKGDAKKGRSKTDSLNTKTFAWEMQSARGTTATVSPYLWPMRGSASCNCAIPTDHPHQCWAHWK